MEKNIKVSVIVPIYNVEEYLNECLDSIVNQTLKEIEVIMVDDGSQDSSAKIAKEYEEKYENFKLVCQPNGGLGKARNVGMQYVNGEYVAFMDSDDYISLNAYEKMYEAAKKHDCDIVVGNVKRFNSKKVFNSGLHTKVFKDTIENTTIIKNLELLYDTTAWNKLFKKSFWLENDFKFPEGILYEDIPVTVPAHFLSKSTTILEDVVYYWRVRDGINKSITQNRQDIQNFLDRLTVLKLVDKFFDENIKDEDAINSRYYKWLDIDFMLYINQLTETDEEYRQRFMQEMMEYLKSVPTEIFERLKAIDKVKYYLIKNNDIDGLIGVLQYQKTQLKQLNVVKNGERYYAEFPFENVPKEYFEVTKELNMSKVSTKIEKVKWNNNLINIRGYMYIPRVNLTNQNDLRLKAKLVNLDNDKSADIEINNFRRVDITQKHGVRVESKKLNNRLYNYDWSGYNIQIDFNDPKILDLGEGKLKILINFDMDGISKEFYLSGPISGLKPRPKARLSNYEKVIVRYNAAYEIIINKYIECAGITNIYYKDKDVYVSGWVRDAKEINELLLLEWNKGIEKTINIEDVNELSDEIIKNKYKNAVTFNCKLPLKFIEESSNLEVDEEDNTKKDACHLYYLRNNEKEPLCGNISDFTDSIINRDDKVLITKMTASGTVYLGYNSTSTYLEKLVWEDDKLKVTVAISSDFFNEEGELKEVVLKSKSEKLVNVRYAKCIETRTENGLNKYTFEINTTSSKNENNYVADIWLNYVVYKFDDKQVQHCILATKINKSSKVFKTHKYIPFVTRRGYFGINVKLKWSWLEKGPRRREAIERYLYPLFRKLPIKKNRVVFEGWWGDKYHCNPRALYEYIDKNEPNYECIWIFKDESTPIEGNAKKVRKNTLKYHYYMATSKYFVNNVNFSDSFVKRDGMVEIQTMHGTPLKTLGLDVPGELPTQEHVDKFLRRCGRWDHLVVQSDRVAEITKSCFAYKKNYLKLGYPRNDVLFSEDKEEICSNVKKELGIPDNKKVILYAPTWRVKNKFDMKLDLDRFSEELSDEYVLLLRVHPFAAKGLKSYMLNDFVKDASDYESIEKLFLITDILITDYSSLMFDYAILNKPMLFFTYDLETYKNNLRGFNLDFEEEAPGPLLETSDEVIDAIKNIDNVVESCKNKIEEFRDKFCQYESGDASKKIVEAVFKSKQ